MCVRARHLRCPLEGSRTRSVRAENSRRPRVRQANQVVASCARYPAIISVRNAASSSSGTPSARAFSSLLPASAPTTIHVVFRLTAETTLPSRRSIASAAASRLRAFSVPVMTNVCPASRPGEGRRQRRQDAQGGEQEKMAQTRMVHHGGDGYRKGIEPAQCGLSPVGAALSGSAGLT